MGQFRNIPFEMVLGATKPLSPVRNLPKRGQGESLAMLHHDKKERVISLVIPVYNEAETLPILLGSLKTLAASLSRFRFEWVLVNDGSRDHSLEILKQNIQIFPELRVVSFSRNFGQQMAVLAGLEFATGDFVAVLDADLQDPPEHLAPMLDLLFEKNADVVLGRRKERTGETFFKIITAKVFYTLIGKFTQGKIPSGVGDFRLMRAPVVEAILSCSETSRFNRGLFSWVGFSQIFYEFDRPPRATGQSSYLPLRMLQLAWAAFVSHTEAMMRLPWIAGLLISGLSFFVAAIFGSNSLPALFLYALTSCVFFLSVAVLGEYLLQVHWEAKRRPNFIVSYLGGNQSRIYSVGRLRSGGLLLSSALAVSRQEFQTPNEMGMPHFPKHSSEARVENSSSAENESKKDNSVNKVDKKKVA